MIPPVSPTLFSVFGRYSRWYLRRHFNAVRVSLATAPPSVEVSRPMIIYLNHAAWWDPLICLHLATTFWPERKHYAPIDSAALKQYPMLGKLGFFGIEKGTRHGSATFLRTCSAILHDPATAVWITAEGAFTDPRDRSRALLPGVAHLAHHLPSSAVIPLAIEYPFWLERRPEALCRFGQALESSSEISVNDAARALRSTQAALAEEAIQKDAKAFRSLICGKGGINIFYDNWRRLRALASRQRYVKHHGDISK